MQLWIDGKLKAQWNVLDSVRDYSYDADLGTIGHNIDVVYTNNCETATTDRNLFVYQIQAGCTVIQSTDAGVKYDKGVGNAAFDGIDVIPGQAEMYWSGALRFKVYGGYTGSTTTTQPSTTTTTTTSVTTTTGPCTMVGDYPKCGEVTITEVLGLITKWANGQATIQQVLTLITAWSRGA